MSSILLNNLRKDGVNVEVVVVVVVAEAVAVAVAVVSSASDTSFVSWDSEFRLRDILDMWSNQVNGSLLRQS